MKLEVLMLKDHVFEKGLNYMLPVLIALDLKDRGLAILTGRQDSGDDLVIAGKKLEDYIVSQVEKARQQTARLCLKLCTNEGDKESIRKAFGIPGPYQKCPVCHVYLNNKGECRCVPA